MLLLAPQNQLFAQTSTPEPTITPTPEPLPELKWVCGNDGWTPPLGCPLIDPDTVSDLTFAYLNSCSDCVPPSSQCRWEWTHDFPTNRPSPTPPPNPDGCGNALGYLPVVPSSGVPCSAVRVGDVYHPCGYRQDGDDGDGVIARMDLTIPFSRSDLRSITNFLLDWDGAEADVKVTFRWCTNGINDDVACTRETTQAYSDALFNMTFEYVYQIDIAFAPQFVTSIDDVFDWWSLHTISFCSSGLIFPPTNCGQALSNPNYDWTNGHYSVPCPAYENGDGTWSSCVNQVGGNRRAFMRVTLLIGNFNDLKDITNLTFNISPRPYSMQVAFQRCGSNASSCSNPANHTAYTTDTYPDLDTMGIDEDRVWSISIVASSDWCNVFVCSAESMNRMYTLDSIYFCASGQPMFPPATPFPPPSPTPEPDTEPCGIPNLTSDWWNGSNDLDCQFTNDWFSLIDPALNSTIPPIDGDDCSGAYIVLGYNDPPAPLGFYPTYRYVRQATMDLLCDEGLYYRVRVRTNDGLTEPQYYPCKPDTRGGKWVRHIFDFGERDTLDAEFQPYLLVASNYLTEPVAPMLPAVDNVLIWSADRKRCDLNNVSDCSIPENVSELNLAFPASITIEYTSFDCYYLFPELDIDLTWINENLRIFVPNVQLCVFWFDLPSLHLFGVQLGFVEVLNVACLVWAFNRFIVTFTK